MTFTESNTVKQMILDSVAPKRHGEPLNIHEGLAPGWRGSLGGELRPARWDYVPAAQLPRQSGDVIVICSTCDSGVEQREGVHGDLS